MKRFTLSIFAALTLALALAAPADARGTFREVELAASASRTETGVGSLVDTFADRGLQSAESPATGCRVYLSVSAASGTTPTLDVTVEATVSGVDFVIATFTQATTTTKETKTALECPEDMKARWVIGGTTPDFTFEVNVTRW